MSLVGRWRTRVGRREVRRWLAAATAPFAAGTFPRERRRAADLARLPRERPLAAGASPGDGRAAGRALTDDVQIGALVVGSGTTPERTPSGRRTAAHDAP